MVERARLAVKKEGAKSFKDQLKAAETINNRNLSVDIVGVKSSTLYVILLCYNLEVLRTEAPKCLRGKKLTSAH